MEEQPELATAPGEQEEWDEEDYDEEDDADIDAEAIEIARRLGEELWADISKVNAERNAAASGAASSTTIPAITAPETTRLGPTQAAPLPHLPRKEEAIIATMKGILALVESDPPAKAALASTNLPNGTSVLALLLECSARGSIVHGIAGPLSQVIVTLARSNALFGNLKQSNASAIQLDKGKRKREEFDEGHHLHPHAFKRPYVPDVDFHNQVVEAVRSIAQALGASPSQTLDPTLVSSIRLQLHQVFLFAVTSSAGGGPSMHALGILQPNHSPRAPPIRGMRDNPPWRLILEQRSIPVLLLVAIKHSLVCIVSAPTNGAMPLIAPTGAISVPPPLPGIMI